ncbi:MAG TPA: hypothetical protein VJU84_08820 [Pyrinomonadaceae bacterium]|nr:hypothetical protein [Pyrinomonadaceae bacterium]
MLNQEQLDAAVDTERKIHDALVAIKKVCSSREISIATTKLEEAALWLEKWKVGAVNDDVRRG